MIFSYMYSLSEQEINAYIDDQLKAKKANPDSTKQVKNAASFELMTTQEIKGFMSKQIALITLHYTCQRYIKQFLENE